MGKIHNDYRKYTDRYGLVQPDRQGKKRDITSDNGLRFTSEYVFALQRNNALREADQRKIIEAFESCEYGQGRLKRHPKNDGQEGPDDYIAVLAACKEIHRPLARRIYNYGKWRLHWYKNKNADKSFFSPFLGRFPAFWAHSKLSAGGNPGLMSTLLWCGAVTYSANGRRGDQDNWVLAWYLIRANHGSGGLFYGLRSLAAKHWIKKFKLIYPHGIGECLDEYYGPNNPDHPAKTYLWDEFGEKR